MANLLQHLDVCPKAKEDFTCTKVILQPAAVIKLGGSCDGGLTKLEVPQECEADTIATEPWGKSVAQGLLHIRILKESKTGCCSWMRRDEKHI